MENHELIYLNATGDIGMRLTNDYLFKALMLKNRSVLKGLLASLLYINYDDITDLYIANGEELPDTFDAKTFVLDLKIKLNNNRLINIEMQVNNLHDWPERSLSYLSRMYDNLTKGGNYIDVLPVIQIGIIDYTLFPGREEFYASYHMRNDKSDHIYSDKFVLKVLDLTKLDCATSEVRLCLKPFKPYI